MGDDIPLDDLSGVPNQIIAHTNTYFDEPACCWRCLRWFRGSRSLAVPQSAIETQKILVLDLDETLVHGTFTPPDQYDFTVTVPIEAQVYEAFIQKRPFVDDFIQAVLNLFYVVVFTASLRQYADPIIDQICPSLPAKQRMFRDDCTFKDGCFVKDLSIFNVPLEQVIIVDNNPASFLLHPENALLSDTWEGNPEDRQLMDFILPVLTECSRASNVKTVLASHHGPDFPK
jgi:Dullard-like phosphatase family protein